MPTALRHPVPTLKGFVERPPASPKHTAHSRVFLAAGVVLLAALVGLGVWAVLNRSTATSQEQPAPVATAPLAGPIVVGDLSRLLRSAGYSLPAAKVNYWLPLANWLDPLTRSAAADYLRVSERTPMDSVLARALQGTVLTGRRDPTAWNARFGMNRLTRLVERPLTGPGGQLDAFGNIRG